jgi:membrane associated rhomboid family serine protease
MKQKSGHGQYNAGRDKAMIFFSKCLFRYLIILLAFAHTNVGAFLVNHTTKRCFLSKDDPVQRRTRLPKSNPLLDGRSIHKPLSLSSLRMQLPWEGDDIRWSTRLRRRLRNSSLLDLDQHPAKRILILSNILLYFYQILTTIMYLQRKYPSYWPSHAAEIVIDSVWGAGSTAMGSPLANAFGFSVSLAKAQPFRYLTSGFFHANFIHLAVNMDSLRRQPSWLETGLGTPLYVSTFLWSIVAGNIMYVSHSTNPFDRNIIMGASSGISGLFGLMWVCLARMNNGGRATGYLIRGMGTLLLLTMWSDSISMTSLVGGFVCGVVTGLLCGPRYVKDYAMVRLSLL